MLIYFFIYVLVFILGLAVGSFLNCMAYRLEHQQKVSGRSFCEHCNHMLGWQDLIPVISFLILRGKCRYCGSSVSLWHPIVELATGIIFLIVFAGLFGISNFSPKDLLSLGFALYIASSLIIIFIYDLKHYLIPDKVLIPAILVAILFNFFVASEGSVITFFINYFFAGLILFGFFFLIFFFSKGNWLGFGDVKFVLFMGVLLGLEKSFLALFIASLAGSVIGILLILFQKKQFKSLIPFGPFLATGTFIMMVFGGAIENIFTSLTLQ